ncbi:MAG: glycosyltransferase [Caulobacteraceae bacterium]
MKPPSVLLVDPALFTGPYDAALTDGLQSAGVTVRWAGRPLRSEEAAELPPGLVDPLYYRGVQDTAKGRGPVWKLRKAASHLLGGLRLLSSARRQRADVVHFQWAVLPLYDAFIMRRLARRHAVVLTIHDLEPFNGAPTSRFQNLGLEHAMQAASHLIVHTDTARETLIGRGLRPDRITTIPHGPLGLRQAAAPSLPRARPDDAPWRVTFFGKIQPYKGVDVLVEALGLIPAADCSKLRVVVAGEPLMPMEPILGRYAELGLQDVLEFRLKRLSEDEMAALFADTDVFVFPYRHIEASGVFYMVMAYGCWIIASDLGAFRDAISSGQNGVRITPSEPRELADAILASIGQRPDPSLALAATSWEEIGVRTRAVYQDAVAHLAAGS